MQKTAKWDCAITHRELERENAKVKSILIYSFVQWKTYAIKVEQKQTKTKKNEYKDQHTWTVSEDVQIYNEDEENKTKKTI